MDAFSVRTKIMIGGGMDALAQRLHRVFLVTDKFMAESGKTNYVTDRLLRNGGSGTIIIPYTRKDVIVIPQEATFEIQDRTFVYRVIDKKAISTQIRTFPVNDGKEYIVESGLQAGETIIAEGAGMVQEGAAVKQKNEK